MLIPTIGMAQLDFKIENIVVSRVIEEKGVRVLEEDGYITEIITIVGTDFGMGPLIRVFCSITNNSDETVTLCRASYKIEVIFSFEGVQYSRRASLGLLTSSPIFGNLFGNRRSLAILPNQTLYFDFFDHYFLGTDLCEWDDTSFPGRRIDHTKKVISTLPTLRVRYRDRNIDITTSEIKNATAENILFIH